MPDLTILALDVATRTGWATSDGDSGAVDFGKPKPKHLAEPAWHGLLFNRADVWIDAMLSRTGAGVLVVERALTHRSAAHTLLGLRAVALMRGQARGIAVAEVWSSSWQPWARQRGWTKGDEADAVAMLAWFTETRLPKMVG